MTRDKIVLAALAAGGSSAAYGPIQVQKLMFLIDREIGASIGGPFFAFRPYDYGPFDVDVYHELDRLRAAGLATLDQSGWYRHYGLTDAGLKAGAEALSRMSPRAQDFIQQAARWVRRLSFNQLVSAIYRYYPEMKANSIFRD